MKDGYTKDSVIAAYREHGSLRAACDRTGAPPYVAFIWLKKAGLLTNSDKRSFGTRGSKLGAEAEREFQRLVPHAMCANKNLEPNCPSFDFDLNGVTIDVKYSSIRKSTGRWQFKTATHKTMCPDWYAAFFAIHPSGDLKLGYNLFLLPNYFLEEVGCLELSPDNTASDWRLFKVSPEKLQQHLMDAAA